VGCVGGGIGIECGDGELFEGCESFGFVDFGELGCEGGKEGWYLLLLLFLLVGGIREEVRLMEKERAVVEDEIWFA